MAYKVVYQKRYLSKIEKLIAYVKEGWSEKVAIEVVASINQKIPQISVNPYLGSLQGRKDIRSIIASEHQRLYYRIEKNKIAILLPGS